MLRGTLEPLSYVLSRGPSSALVNAAVDTKYRNWTDLRWGRMCMERHAIVSIRWHDMARRGNEGADEGALRRVCHALCMWVIIAVSQHRRTGT